MIEKEREREGVRERKIERPIIYKRERKPFI